MPQGEREGNEFLKGGCPAEEAPRLNPPVPVVRLQL